MKPVGHFPHVGLHDYIILPLARADYACDHRVYTVAVRVAEPLAQVGRNILRTEDPGTAGIVDIVIYVCNMVGFKNHPTLKSRCTAGRMVKYPVPHLIGQVELFELFHHPYALIVMGKRGIVALSQHPLPRVTERRVTEIMPQRNSLRKVLIQPQSPRNRPCDLTYLKRVGEPRPVMVSLRRKKDLCLVHQPPEGFRVNDPVPVALKLSAEVAFVYRIIASPRVLGEKSEFRKGIPLSFVNQLTDRHNRPPAHTNNNINIRKNRKYSSF
ncbi:unknown [Candidatus Colimorpha enterica]|uniref:Uncharacterized protein n=1 Tax=Candidatus Colimorpha enterica TaxID=3083063 RepID=R6TTS0_9BACT|nr:unknown [Candidatus Colimorpha enterica]